MIINIVSLVTFVTMKTTFPRKCNDDLILDTLYTWVATLVGYLLFFHLTMLLLS